MKTNHIPYLVPINIEDDRLSGFLKEITLIPHAFGHQCFDSTAICDDRIIGDFELIYIVDGESRITIGGKEFICGRGDIVLIPPFIVHKIQTSKTHPHNNYWFHFDVYPLYRYEDFLHAMLAQENEYRIPLGLFNQMTEIYGRIEEEFKTRHPGNAAFIHSIISQIIIIVLHKNSGNIPETMKYAKSDPEVSAVNQCLEYIKKNAEEKIRVRDIAGLVHVSKSYMFKAFSRNHENTSEQIHTALQGEKREAAYEKHHPAPSRKFQICWGFHHLFTSAEFFKQYYGCSPRDYIEKIKSFPKVRTGHRPVNSSYIFRIQTNPMFVQKNYMFYPPFYISSRILPV